MDNKAAKTISKLTKIIISLCVLIFALLFLVTYVVLNTKHKEEEQVAWCGTITIDSGFPSDDLFKANCASCHHLDKILVGPALRGVINRLPSEQWFDTYITHPDSLIKSNDPYLISILNPDTNLRSTHISFAHFSNKDLDELKAYLQE